MYSLKYRIVLCVLNREVGFEQFVFGDLRDLGGRPLQSVDGCIICMTWCDKVCLDGGDGDWMLPFWAAGEFWGTGGVSNRKMGGGS